METSGPSDAARVHFRAIASAREITPGREFRFARRMWPNIVPPSLTIRGAASAPSSQLFVMVGAFIMIPAVLGYTAYSYSVFRGKVAADTG